MSPAVADDDASSVEEEQLLLLLQLANERINHATTLDFGDARRQAEALVYWKDALQLKEQVLGLHHPQVIPLYLKVAKKFHELEKYHKAKQQYATALQRYSSLEQGRLSLGALSGWIGLGRTLMDMEKWHEAAKAFQSAARLELYTSIQSILVAEHEKSEHDRTRSETQTMDEALANVPENLDSILFFRDFVEFIETRHRQNRKRVWSHFPSLPENIDRYLDALQATVYHEVQGDLYFHQEQYRAASVEYQTSLTLLREQVHSTKDGVTSDELWLLRKKVLAEWKQDISERTNDAKGQQQEELPRFSLNHFSPIGIVDEKEDGAAASLTSSQLCSSDSYRRRVCQTLWQADSILFKSNMADHKIQRQVRNLFLQAHKLLELYRSVAPLTNDHGHPFHNLLLLQGLDDLQEKLVPNGWTQRSKQQLPELSANEVWEDVQRLSILAESSSSSSWPLLTNSDDTAPSSCPVLHAPLTHSESLSDESDYSIQQRVVGGLALVLILLPWILLVRQYNKSKAVGLRPHQRGQPKSTGATTPKMSRANRAKSQNDLGSSPSAKGKAVVAKPKQKGQEKKGQSKSTVANANQPRAKESKPRISSSPEAFEPLDSSLGMPKDTDQINKTSNGHDWEFVSSSAAAYNYIHDMPELRASNNNEIINIEKEERFEDQYFLRTLGQFEALLFHDTKVELSTKVSAQIAVQRARKLMMEVLRNGKSQTGLLLDEQDDISFVPVVNSFLVQIRRLDLMAMYNAALVEMQHPPSIPE